MTEIRIGALAPAETEGLRESLPDLLPGPLRAWFRGMPEDRRSEYWIEEIRSALSEPGAAAFAARAGGRAAGLAVAADQPWDTRVLGRRIMTIRHLAAGGEDSQRASILERLLDETMRHAEELGAECLVHRCYADDAPAIHALERRGFLLMDTLLDYGFDFQRSALPVSSPLPPEVRLRLATREDLEGLVDVSRRAFPNLSGRFHADERIPRSSAVRVYEEWIRSCVEGWVDWVVAAECNGAVVGYSTWKKPSEIESRHGLGLGHLSLGAVVPEHAGRGLFRALTLEGMRLLADHSRRIECPTSATNIPVQRAFVGLGWRNADARHGFHRWSKP